VFGVGGSRLTWGIGDDEGIGGGGMSVGTVLTPVVDTGASLTGASTVASISDTSSTGAGASTIGTSSTGAGAPSIVAEISRSGLKLPGIDRTGTV
jgi:hypothetical protein